jgi:hypothetical protein
MSPSGLLCTTAGSIREITAAQIHVPLPRKCSSLSRECKIGMIKKKLKTFIAISIEITFDYRKVYT